MTKRKSLVVIAALGAMMLTAAACSKKTAGTNPTPTGGGAACPDKKFGCVTVGKNDPIHLGAIQTITGATATLGLPQVNGVYLGIDYLNGKFDGIPGTILGHKVTLTTQDETDAASGQCGKAGGQTAATKLAADPSIVAVVGTTCSSSALGVADTILGNKGIILVSSSNTSPKLTEEGVHNPFYFRTAQNDVIQTKVVADFVYKNLGIKTAATMNDGGPYTQGLTSGFAKFFKGLGGTVTADEAFDPTVTDFKPVLTSVAQGHPGLIYFPDFNPPCALIAAQAKQIPDLSGVQLMGSEGCNDATFLKTAGAAADGVYLSSPKASPGAASALFKQLSDAYKTDYGIPSSSFWPNAFDAFNVIAQAIQAAGIKQADGSLLIPRTALQQAMYGIKDYEGVTGPLTCISSGDCQSQTAVNIVVYKAPDTPYNPATAANPTEVFSERFTLGEAFGS
jgi:branched-chain amino acid transport system substrate-binding protein